MVTDGSQVRIHSYNSGSQASRVGGAQGSIACSSTGAPRVALEAWVQSSLVEEHPPLGEVQESAHTTELLNQEEFGTIHQGCASAGAGLCKHWAYPMRTNSGAHPY